MFAVENIAQTFNCSQPMWQSLQAEMVYAPPGQNVNAWPFVNLPVSTGTAAFGYGSGSVAADVVVPAAQGTYLPGLVAGFWAPSGTAFNPVLVGTLPCIFYNNFTFARCTFFWWPSIFAGNPFAAPSPTSSAGGGAPGIGGPPVPPKGEPVNTATGDFYSTRTDIALPGPGPSLAMTRTYSSAAAYAGETSVLGPGWSFTFGASLAVNSQGDVTVTNGNGSQTTFIPTPGSPGSFVSPQGMQATLVQNSSGSYTYTLNEREIMTFSGAGRLLSIADLNGNAITLSYTGSELTSASNNFGETLTFSYKPSGQLASVSDGTGRSVGYQYDGSGNLHIVIDVRLGQTTYTYNASHFLLTVEDPNLNVVLTNTYDSQGRVVQQVTPGENGPSSVTQFSYVNSVTSPGSATYVIDPDGNETAYLFQGGLVTAMTEAYGTSSARSWTYSYGDMTNPFQITSMVDADQNQTSYTYDGNGNMTNMTAGSESWSATYDSMNDPTQTTNAHGVTTNTFNATGNLTSSSTPVGDGRTAVAKYVLNAQGEPTSITDPAGNITTYHYNPQGLLDSKTDNAGDQTTYCYWPDGNVAWVTSPRGNPAGGTTPPNCSLSAPHLAPFTTNYVYDPAGNLDSVTDPKRNVTAYKYDPDGNLAQVTDPNLNVTKYYYWPANELELTVRPDQSTISYYYYPGGNLQSQVVQNASQTTSSTTSYMYDAFEHLKTKTAPGAGTASYVFDPLGNLTSQNGGGVAASYGYNANNQLTSITPTGATVPTVTYGYDGYGRLTSMGDASGNTSYGYWATGWLKSETNGAGQAVSYTEDLDGNPSTITYPNGKTVTDGYNTAEELHTVQDWLGNTTTISYNPDGEPTTIAFPATTGETDTTNYDGADQISSITDTQGSTTLASQTYARDPAYQVKGETDTSLNAPGTTNSYGYNTLEQLTGASTGGYAYNTTDSPTTIAGTPGYTYTANQLTGVPANPTLQTPAATIAYNGPNRASSTPAGGPATTYGYDYLNRLTTVTRAASGSIPAITETNTYDGNGLLQTSQNGASSTQLTWDTQTTIPTPLADNGTSIIYGPDQLPLEQVTASGSITFDHHDQQGSTRLTTNTSGQITSTATYDPYGNLSASTGAQPILGYDAQYTDPATGLTYLRARWYDPQTAQFLTQDPLEDITGEPYNYVNDNPLNGGDPTGLILGIPGTPSWSDVGSFFVNNWRPIASAAGDLATAGACAFSAGTLCLQAIAADAAAQSALVATGPGSVGQKAGLIGMNLLLAGGGTLGPAAAELLDEIEAAPSIVKIVIPSWVRPFMTASSTAPNVGLTAAQLAGNPWKPC